MASLADWQTFLSVQAGAAATLTGLVFVAVSINLGRIMQVPGLPGRGAESIAQLLQVFFVSAMGLIPRQPLTMLGVEILAVVLLSGAVQVTAQLRYSRARAGHPLSWLMMRVVMTQLAAIPFCVCSVLLFLGNTYGLYWLVAGFVVSLIAGVITAWVLLVEILR